MIQDGRLGVKIVYPSIYNGLTQDEGDTGDQVGVYVDRLIVQVAQRVGTDQPRLRNWTVPRPQKVIVLVPAGELFEGQELSVGEDRSWRWSFLL